MAKTVLLFGCGPLQRSIIGRCHLRGIKVVGIDPNPEASARELTDAFEVVGGQDFEGTCRVVEKYGVNAIVTAATDKPLVMMARIAARYGFPFYSEEAAHWSTDKYQMKQRFTEGGIPHARGRLIRHPEDVQDMAFPLIIKPRDNSGSRGVILCTGPEQLEASLKEALACSRLDTVLAEEVIGGQEYSIESLHWGGRSEVIQFTRKKTTPFPYNVELEHRQPAGLTPEQEDSIRAIVSQIGKALRFDNCPSHTELKINPKGIYVIETSPRLGGDFITSVLTPLSTGINMEDQMLHLALGEPVDLLSGRIQRASGVRFFTFPQGRVRRIDPSLYALGEMPGVSAFSLSLKEGQAIPRITSSLDRYGQFCVEGKDAAQVDALLEKYEQYVKERMETDE